MNLPQNTYSPNNNNNNFNDFELGEGLTSGKVNSIQLEMRLGFIRKVYGILLAQLGLTVFMCLIAMTSVGFVQFQVNNMWLFYICLIAALVLPCVIVCCQTA